MYYALNFSNQRDLIIAHSLAAQAHPQSKYLHQARYGSDHILYKHRFRYNMCVFRAYAKCIIGFCVNLILCIYMY